jgi:Putative type VII ESX secretion system translocon, EccE
VSDSPRYRFGALERRGVLLGLRPGQLILVAAAAILVVAVARSTSTATALASMLLITAITAFVVFVPISGQTVEERFPVSARWIIHRARGAHRFSSSSPLSGDPIAQPQFPGALAGVSIVGCELGTSGALGVIKDRRAGTFTAVLSVSGSSFALLDPEEKARRLSSWGTLLSGLARERGVVHRLQWVQRTRPDTGDDLGGYLRDNIAVPIRSAVARSYLEVLADAAPVTSSHETFIAVQIHASKAASAIRAAGGGDVGAFMVLRREVIALAHKLENSGLTVGGALTSRLIGGALRAAFDPSSTTTLTTIGARDSARIGATPISAGPMSTEATWSAYRTEEAWHRTYWIAEWPRIDADPDFLAPLLLSAACSRSVSVTMEPVSPLKALRAVESARTSAAADEELRNRAGFATTARRWREHDALENHEQDLSDGHALYRFAGFITVTGRDLEELDAASAEIEDAAARSLLDLRRMSGQQDIAFTYTLPLGRGLR